MIPKILTPRAAVILAICVASGAAYPQQRIDVLRHGDLSNWEEESFVDHTLYESVSQNDKQVIKATTDGTASGMFRKIDVDLTRTPYLNWSWRVDNVYTGNDEQTKAGDDYPARVYVVVSGGLFFWKTRAINYVWSSNQDENSAWPNAFTGNARMIAVQTGADQVGQWVTEKRNVRDDLRAQFGEDFTEINAVAIMTDSDNHEQPATAYYDQIYFSAH